MILGSDKAKVGNRALGETFKSAVYPVELNGKTYNLYDTVGLGEHSGGTVESTKAIGNLHRLVADLSNSEGVHLLVFVIKRGRLTEPMHKNYTLFHRGFCDSEVPIVIIVTGCENIEPTMDRWWNDNESSFTKARMSFEGHACVCASKGRRTKNGYRNADLVEQSVQVVRELIVRHCKTKGWKKVRYSQSSVTKFETSEFTDTLPMQPHIVWLKKVIGSMIDLFRSSKIPVVYTDLYDRLTNVFTSSEAEQIIRDILQKNDSQVLTVFSKSQMTNLMELPSNQFLMTSPTPSSVPSKKIPSASRKQSI
jgi:hypothetical protein